jgi:TolB-like protein
MHYKLFSVKNVLSKHTISLYKKKFFIAFYIVIAILSATHLSGQSSEKKINILVYPFTNSGNAQYSWVSTGMTQSVISDLSKISSISVFTEEDRKKAIQEIELGMTGLVKESDVVKVGTIMGAQLICSGNYTVSGNRIRINAKLVSVEKATVNKAITLDGTIDNLFELQDRIVTELMSTAQQTNIPGIRKPVFTLKDKENIKKLPRPDIKAFELYAKGLENYDINPQEALKYFNQALSIDTNYFYAYLSAGGVCSVMGNLDNAESYYARAAEILKKEGLENSLESASLYYTMGINFWNRGDSDRAVTFAVQAFNILAASGEDYSRLAAATLMLCGAGYRTKNRIDDALKCTQQSIAIYEYLGLQNTSDYAWGLNNLAVTYSMLGSHQKSVELYRQCLKIWDALGLTVSMGTAYTYCQLGYEYYVLKQYEKAYDNLTKGRDYCISLKLNNSFNFAYYMWYLSLVYSEGFGDYCIAAEFLNTSVNIFEKQKNPVATDAQKSLQELEKKCGFTSAKRKKEEELISAASNGNITSVKNLIKEKININARAYWKGESALYNAAAMGDTNMVKFLVENGADVNIRMYKGFTPLMVAINKGHYDIIRYLLSKNALVNMPDCRGVTPLMYAVSTPTSNEIIELLITKGADVNARDDNGESVVQKANSKAVPVLRKYGAK